MQIYITKISVLTLHILLSEDSWSGMVLLLKTRPDSEIPGQSDFWLMCRRDWLSVVSSRRLAICFELDPKFMCFILDPLCEATAWTFPGFSCYVIAVSCQHVVQSYGSRRCGRACASIETMMLLPGLGSLGQFCSADWHDILLSRLSWTQAANYKISLY